MRGRRWLFALIMVATVLAMAEAVARLFPPMGQEGASRQFDRNPELRSGGERFWTPDARLFWRMRPRLDADFGGIALRTNAGGFRDRAHPVAPDPDVFTIACVGDSSTFGWAVPNEAERFCDRLAAILAPGRDRPVRALNFGQSGYSTHQGLIVLEEEILPLRPQVVVLLFGPNDYATAAVFADHEQPALGAATAEAQAWLARSALYRSLRRGLIEAPATASAPAVDEQAGTEADRRRRVPLARYRSNLHRMIELCRAAGATPVLLTYPRRPLNPLLPCPVPTASGAELAGWHAAVEAAAGIYAPGVQGVVELSEREADAALEIWDTLPAAARSNPAFAYGRAYILFRAGRTAEADAILAGLPPVLSQEPGCALDLFSTAAFRYHEEPAATAYAAVARDLAAASAVAFVDAEARLRAAQEEIASRRRDQAPTALLSAWFRSDTYFVDVVHPSARGHAVIASAIAAALPPAMAPVAPAASAPPAAAARP